MSKLTDILGLFKYDPETDGANTFNITQALNNNWDKIDTWVSGIKSTLIGKASLGENGAVPVTQGGTGATTPQAALAALGSGVRPNLLDNAIFVGGGTAGKLPINQREKTEYSNGFGIDRWYSVQGNTMEVLQDGVKFQYVNNNYVAWQVLSNQLSYGDTITVSALLSNGILLTSSGTLSPELEDIGTPAYNDYSVHYTINTNHLNIVGFDSSKDITTQAVKLEFGENQTLAYQDADGMWHLLPQPESDYATQLAKCQRYLLDITPNIIFNQSYIAICTYAGSLFACIPIPVSMRLAPSFDGDVSSFQIAYPDGTFGVPTSIRVVTYSSGYVGLSILADSAAAGQVADIRLTDLSKKWFLNAEL